MAGVEGALVGLGNPLLDISAVVDQAFLDKYEVIAFKCMQLKVRNALSHDKLYFDTRNSRCCS